MEHENSCKNTAHKITTEAHSKSIGHRTDSLSLFGTQKPEAVAAGCCEDGDGAQPEGLTGEPALVSVMRVAKHENLIKSRGCWKLVFRCCAM